MNERIRQLSEQAHRSTADELAHLQRVHNRTYDLYESAAIYNEKFAELIVRECVNICYRTDTEYEGHKVKSTVIASKVAEHFGVEE